jgi:hypothetical protein
MKVAISKDTTFVTGPLRVDGCTDYVAALNELCSKGVTPDNNAAVAFWQAVGPKEIAAELRPAFFQQLGTAVLSDHGPYLVSLEDYARHDKGGEGSKTHETFDEEWLGRIYGELEVAMAKPWSETEHPLLARWLKANDKPLQVLVEGVRRSRFFSPIVVKDGGPLRAFCGWTMELRARDAVRAMMARAMLHVGCGKLNEAWGCILAGHRLARLLRQKPFFIHHLIGCSLEAWAARAEIAFIFYATPATSDFASCRLDLEGLPSAVSMADVLNTGERLFNLDCLNGMAQSDWALLQMPEGSEPIAGEKARTDALRKLAAHPRIDWNGAYRVVNAYFDRLVAAQDQPTYIGRLAVVDAINAETQQECTKGVRRNGLTRLLARRSSSEQMGRDLGAVFLGFCGISGTATMIVDCRAQMLVSLTGLAFALAGYRADHGEYPPALAAIEPVYQSPIPKDLFTDGELVYKRRNDGYLLYSLGPSGKDAGGESYHDHEERYENVDFADWPDNIAICMPFQGEP